MDRLANKQLVILGLARQGKALARFAVGAGARVVISDMRPAGALQAALADLADLPLTFVLGDHPLSLLDGTDILALSGGVPADAPLVLAARERGIEVTNDEQEFIRRCPARVIGITGAAGKTTTTALTGFMGQCSGRTTWVGGNIGRPLLPDLPNITANDLVVAELSSFQLEIWQQSPPIAAILNITPNHLDRHKTMAVYAAAKANIVRFQGANGVAVLCADDGGAMAVREVAPGRVRLFSLTHEPNDGAFVRAGQIWLRDGQREQVVCEVGQVLLPGRHNLYNVLAATLLADSAGVPVAAINQAIATFRGVEHRLELVATINGVAYVNDSIATAPERALAAVDAFNQPLILLAGGKDKDLVWGEWAQRVSGRVKTVVLFGDLAPLLYHHLSQTAQPPTLIQVQTLPEAVAAAAGVATAGDVVLLSPGGTSFDAFTDFAERGRLFRHLVNQQQASAVANGE